MTLYVNPADPASTLAAVAALPPTTGTCVFIDIVGSTAMKDGSLVRWVAAVTNTFERIRAFLSPNVPVKSIGDELMFFIPDADLAKSGSTFLALFGALASIAHDPDQSSEPGSLLPEVKVVACHCTAVYALSFIDGAPDYYGKEIDLAARLLSQAGPRELVMNDAFSVLVRRDFMAYGDVSGFPEVARIVGPAMVALKGFALPVAMFRVSP